MGSKKANNEKEGQHINVFIRIRPFNNQEIGKKCTNTTDVVNDRQIHVKQTYADKIYNYDHVFDATSTQEDVFNIVVNPLIEEVLNGYSCTVFAYGQTGSGKTYTIAGPDSRNLGIIPRSINQIFELRQRFNSDFSMRVSYLELYNEELFDLLSSKTDTKNIRIFDDKNQKGSVILHGLEEVTVTTRDEVYKLLEMGSEKRRTASTLMNANSSRSHTVFTIIVHMREETTNGEEFVRIGKLNLVDLAGSENISRSGSIDQRVREAGSINQSLLALGRVIKALTDKGVHIPYRESKLTRILQDSLGGHAKASLIANISSAHINIEETVSTLEYALRARCIQNRPKVNQHTSRTALIRQYNEEIERIKKDLQSCNNGSGIYLNEDNYNKLLSDMEIQHHEILVKLNHITSLEDLIKDKEKQLSVVESTQLVATNNTKLLQNEKQILEEDIITAKIEKERCKKDLDEYKVKYDRLIRDLKKLISAVTVKHRNEEILHKKLSLLYDTSLHNKASTEDFYMIFNKLNSEMSTRIWSCINFTENVITDGSEMMLCLKNKLDETFCALKETMRELSRTANDIKSHKNEYLDINNSIEDRVIDYTRKINQIVDKTFVSINYSMNKIHDEHINEVHSTIQNMSDVHIKNFKLFIDDLKCIQTCISKAAERVFDLTNIEQDLRKKSGALEALNQNLLDNCRPNMFYVQTANKNISDKFDKITNLLNALREKYSSKLDKLYDACQENIQVGAQLHDISTDLKITTCESLANMKDVCHQFSTDVDGKINKQIDAMKYLEQEEIELQKSANQEINKAVDLIREQKYKSDILFTEFKDDINEYVSNICERERVYNNYISELSKSYQETNDSLTSTVVTVNNMYSTVYQITDQTDKVLENCNLKLMSANTCAKQRQSEMSKVVNDFCKLKLKHPTHMDDTPQHMPSDTLITDVSLFDSSADDDE